MKNLKVKADQVNAWAARRVLNGHKLPHADDLRDKADEVTGGDLDTVQLDILCDTIDARIAKWLNKEPVS